MIVNPKGKEDGDFRVFRGGAFYVLSKTANGWSRMAVESNFAGNTLCFRIVLGVK